MRSKGHNGKEPPERDPTSIGNLLLGHGFVTPDGLEEAKAFQKDHPDILMGEALVRMEKITRNELEAVCEQQELLRSKRKKATAVMIQVATRMAKKSSLES